MYLAVRSSFKFSLVNYTGISFCFLPVFLCTLQTPWGSSYLLIDPFWRDIIRRAFWLVSRVFRYAGFFSLQSIKHKTSDILNWNSPFIIFIVFSGMNQPFPQPSAEFISFLWIAGHKKPQSYLPWKRRKSKVFCPARNLCSAMLLLVSIWSSSLTVLMHLSNNGIRPY